ncbi:MAG: DUF4177 domain-containing protein [Anaerolineales bacterium]|jgi:hypothetical protein
MAGSDWVYEVFSVGSIWRSISDEQLAGVLNRLAAEGWEIVNVTYPYRSQPKIIARRQQSTAERRQEGWPGA